MLRRVSIQAAVMSLVGAFFLFSGRTTAGSIVLTLAVILVALALFARPVYQTIHEVTLRLGRMVANAIGATLLTLMYYSVFFLGSLYLRVLRKDPLNLQVSAEAKSNWIVRAGSDDATYAKQYSHLHGSDPVSPATE